MNKLKLIALFSAFLLFVPFSYAHEQTQQGFISIGDSITKDVEPNLAKVTFAVENTADDAKKASLNNNEISNRIITNLKNIIKPETDVIKTVNFSIRPVYSTEKNGTRVIKNYTAVNTVIVETRDINKITKIIDNAIESGANRTESLTFSFDNEKNVCNDLYPILIKDMMKQANIIANSAGYNIDGIKQLSRACSSDKTTSNGRFYAKDLAAGTIESATTPVEAGKVKIRIYINADFYIKK